MKKELQEELYKKYPRIFRQKDLPMSQTCMCWGIDCGDGWYRIIDQLCSLVQGHVDSRVEYLERKKKELTVWKCMWAFLTASVTSRWDWAHTFTMLEDWVKTRGPIHVVDYQVEAAQVKEKYGTLRFYVDRSDDIINAYISMATAMSGVTCERCGNPGKLRYGAWVRTICDKCEVKRKKGG